MTPETCANCGGELRDISTNYWGCEKCHNSCEKFKHQNETGVRQLNETPQNHSPQERVRLSSKPSKVRTEDTEPSSNNEGGSDNNPQSLKDLFKHSIPSKSNIMKKSIGTAKISGSDYASSLSDKIFLVDCANDRHGRLRKTGSVGNNKRKRLYVKDVKESVKKLKDRFDWATLLHEEIDKIFGGALI